MNVIEVKNVWKKYRLHYEKEIFLKEMLSNLLRRKKYYDEFWALKDINIEIEKGETVGIIGKNGSGKTTILKLLSGITEPSKGSIEIKGRVAGLLELGAGFHPELTGRENIYLNGAILGLSRKEISKNIDFIISFADIGDFIDAQVKTYSSGMYLRLGFAIAAQVDPDILLIDEVLAVGDIAFQKKCFERIEELKKKGKTIIFVSHNLSMVEELCDRVVCLNKGKVHTAGAIEETIRNYLILLSTEDKKLAVKRKGIEEKIGMKLGKQEIKIEDVYFLDGNSKVRKVFETGQEMRIRIKYSAPKRINNPVFGLAIYREDGIHITGPNTRANDFKINFVEGRGEIEYIISSLPLLKGKYKITVAAHDYNHTYMYDYHDRLFQFKVIPGKVKEKYGIIALPSEWKLVKR